MARFRKIVLATVASGLVSLCSAANAGEIYNNLPNISVSGGTDAISADGPAFNSFSTGNTASSLLDIKMMLSGISSTPGDPLFTVSLLSDALNRPGTVLMTLGTFHDSTLNAGASIYVISVASYALAADTRYWVELSGPSSSVAWDYASNATGAGIQGEFWAYSPGGVIAVSSNTDPTPGPYQMSVTTTQTSDLPPVLPDPGGGGGGGGGTTPPSTVPEPGTFCQALSALGIGAIAFARRRMVRS